MPYASPSTASAASDATICGPAARRGRRARGVEVVAVNDIAPVPTLAHLLEYDSTYGRLRRPSATRAAPTVGGHAIPSPRSATRTPSTGRTYGVDIVIESTGDSHPRRRGAPT